MRPTSTGGVVACREKFPKQAGQIAKINQQKLKNRHLNLIGPIEFQRVKQGHACCIFNDYF